MADQADFSVDASPNIVTIIDYFLEGLTDPTRLANIQKVLSGAQIDALITTLGAQKKALATRDESQNSIIDNVEKGVDGAVAWGLAHLVAHLLGIEVPPSALRATGKATDVSATGQAVGETFMAALRPAAGDLQPGDAGATRLISEIASFTLKSWFEGVLLEYTESIGGLVHPIEHAGELGRELIDAMGFGRLARVALRPLAQIGIATPLEWDLHKTYRPTLLSEASVIRQGFRGKWDWADVEEVLQRKGYSDAAINALINEQQKFLDTADLATMVWLELLPLADAQQTLVDQGWDNQTASKHFNVQKIKAEDAIHRQLATDAIAAYVDRRIDDQKLSDTLAVTITGQHERDLLTTVARGKRALNAKFLSAPQVADMVKVGILGFTDYRDALAREGYDEAAGAALELLLRHTIDTKTSLDHLKAQQAAERAQAKADAAAARKAKEDAAAAKAALARQGSIAEIKAAVVRGLIPIARYEQILTPRYDADTVQAMLTLAEQDRATYVASQQKAADAAKRVDTSRLNLSQLRAAVLTHVLTLDQFQAMLTASALDAADVQILADTLKQQLADRTAADAKRTAAAQRSATTAVPLATMEALVRAGHRSLAEFDAYLVALGEDDAARAAIEDLLQVKIASDQAAAATRANANAVLGSRGLSLDQFRRAVVLGVKSPQDYSAFLVQQKFSADAVSVLVADATDAATQAAAVRARRSTAKVVPGSLRLSLTTIARAARLGLVTIDAYAQRLTADGYTDEDVALDVDLLTVEIAQTAAAREAGGKDLQQWQSDVLQTLTDAQTRALQIDAQLKAKQLSLATLEAAVKAGERTIDDYVSTLESQGFDAADAELQAALLEQKIAAKGSTPPAPAPKVSRTKKKAAPHAVG